MTGLAFDLPPLLGGRYRVLGPLGRGAIAQVVRARDERTGTDVALKVLYPNLRDAPSVADRFRREVQIVRRIEHPHVIRIHDLGEADGHVFLVMDLHPGGDLADRTARVGRLPAGDLVALARQVGGALEAAHRAGVVHRDIKPQNVLCGAGEALDVRLVDFGLARTADFAGLTTGATVLGTPEYMAPEVIAEGHADPRSDVYSLGAVLFEAATGRLPFGGDSPYQILRRHLTEPAPRARTLAGDLPPSIDEAIARALAKDPLDRFATAADLVVAIEAGGEAPVTALVPVTSRGRLAALAVRPACRRCGGVLNEAAGACVDCGARALRLRPRSYGGPGVAVLVTGPGDPADKIDGRTHVALCKLLDELPAGSAKLDAIRKRAPRLPFFVADALDPESADDLVDRLGEIGLLARVERGASLVPEVRKKVRRMGLRYLAVLATSFGGVWGSFGKHPLGFVPLLALVLLGPFVSTAIAYRRPIVRRTGKGQVRDDGERRLAHALPRLRRRTDRRLCGRILERLATVRDLGQGEAGKLLAARAAAAAEAIADLDEGAGGGDEGALTRRLAAPEAIGDGGSHGETRHALDRLRSAERDRDALVADLLRSWSRLDGLCIKAARAGALDAAGKVVDAARDADELRRQVEAEEEVAKLLGEDR